MMNPQLKGCLISGEDMTRRDELMCRFLIPVMILATFLAAPVCRGADDAPIPTDKNGLPLWEIRTWDDFPVRIELQDYDDLARLLARVPVADFSREQIAFRC